MQRTAPKSIGEIVEEALRFNAMDRRLMEVRASEAWPRVVGEGLARLTGKPWTRDGVMTIRIPSAALRNELSMNRTALIAAINSAVGTDDVVKEIKFLG